MKFNTPNYDHAWNILIHELSRGRVSYAYGMLRLLAPTLQDSGLVNVIAGDLYNAAGDRKMAVVYYAKAHELYTQEKREKEAMALAEHIKIINQ